MQLVRRAKDAGFTPEHDTWLHGMTYSQAFVTCVGAGPWKLPRRKKIQQEALRALGNRDLASRVTIPYPLDWQNHYISNMRASLKTWGLSMEDYCRHVRKVDDRYQIYLAAGSPNGTKVLSLFCRDALQIESFPIDRHVRRLLVENGLPTDESAMIDICLSCAFDPNSVAHLLVRFGSRDQDGTMNAQNLLDTK